jgi:hypothetical protein
MKRSSEDGGWKTENGEGLTIGGSTGSPERNETFRDVMRHFLKEFSRSLCNT